MPSQADESRVEVGSVTGAPSDRLGVLGAKLGEVVSDARQHHVAVVQLAEHVLEVACAPPPGLAGAAEAELGRFEHVAQPLRRDPHVVLGIDLLGFERVGHE